MGRMLLLVLLAGRMVMAEVNARDFGAKGDGVTDDTAAIQAALNAAATGGPVCLVPAGKYRLDGALTVPPGVSFLGATAGVPHSEHPIGTVLLAFGGRGNADGEPLVTLKPNATIAQMIVHYPEQRLPDVAPYPWTIRADGELCQIRDMTLTNPYQALDLGTRWNELHTVRNIFACPLKIGVYIDQCTDIGRIENVHFNPNFWTRMALEPKFEGDIKAYLEENLIGFMIGKTDWEYISGCFVIFPKIGWLFDDFGHGPGNVVISTSGADICPVAVRFNATQPHAGVRWTGGQIMGMIEIAESNRGPVSLTNCGFWSVPQTRYHIDKRGPSTLHVTSCQFTGWDAAGEGIACIQASGGRVVISGSDFSDPGKLAIDLQPGLTAATITGNLLRGQAALRNTSGAKVEVGYNTYE